MDPKDLIGRLTAAEAQGDADAFMAYLHADIEWLPLSVTFGSQANDGSPPFLQGSDAVRQWFATTRGVGYNAETINYEQGSPHHAIVSLRVAPESGPPGVGVTVHVVFSFEDGLVRKIVPYPTVEAARSVVARDLSRRT